MSPVSILQLLAPLPVSVSTTPLLVAHFGFYFIHLNTMSTSTKPTFDPATYRKPKSAIGAFVWRWKMWFEATFVFSMLEPWEKILLSTLPAPLRPYVYLRRLMMPFLQCSHYLRFIMDPCYHWRIPIPTTSYYGDEGARGILPFGQKVYCPLTMASFSSFYAIGFILFTVNCK